MNSIWPVLVPSLKSLSASDRRAIVAGAKRGAFTMAEVVLLVVWTLLVFMFTQQVIRQAAHPNPFAFALVANLVITLPLMLAVFVPVYLRKVRRHIVAALDKRPSAG